MVVVLSVKVSGRAATAHQAHAVRIVSTDTILRFINTLIIIITY